MATPYLRTLIAQINTTVGDLEGNSQKIIRSLREARISKAKLVTFPEMAITGYPPEDVLLKKHFVADNIKALRSVLRETRGLIAVIGFVDVDKKGRLYNAAAVALNGKIVQIYRKIHLPNYGVFDEKRYFMAGIGPMILNLGHFSLGVTICEDIWLGDSFVYQPNYKGIASILVNISASPFHYHKYAERLKLIKNLAIKTKAHVLYHNLVGGQDELVFDGGSVVVSPKGSILAEGKRFEEEWMIVDIPVVKPSRVPIKEDGFILVNANAPNSFFKTILSKAAKRKSAMSQEEEMYKALVLGTRDYLLKNGFKKALIGISGGIDSALVASIAVDALGPENVTGVTMPSPYTSTETYEDSKKLANNLSFTCLEFRIDDILSQYLRSMKSALAGTAPDTTEENLQARIRGNILMALSNKFGYLVLTTGNKSEMATGYCTLYGDMAGGFAVIKDVPKTMVYKLVRYRNSLKKGRIPQGIIDRPPTAELRHGQKDQDTLPPYTLLDKFLELYIEKDLSVEEIVKKGIPSDMAKRSAQMVDHNEYKRRQSPPGVKISPKAFGRDRRMPITNRYAS